MESNWYPADFNKGTGAGKICLHGKLKKTVCTPPARQVASQLPPQAHPPVGVPGQEILVADSADHSSAEQTDTTLCPTQGGAEWEETVLCGCSWGEGSGRGRWKLTPWWNPSSPLLIRTPSACCFSSHFCAGSSCCQAVADPAWYALLVKQKAGKAGGSKRCFQTGHRFGLWQHLVCS